MPYLTRHLPVFEASGLDFTWHIVHGAAANTGSTKWCKPQSPRLSRDGSETYINSISKHPRVRVYQRQWWAGGKDEMSNEPLKHIKETCILHQIDSDEIYTPEQLQKIHALFVERPTVQRIYLKCNYYMGQDIFVDPHSDRNNVWLRAFRYLPGQRFLTHEPVNLAGNRGLSITAEETAKMGLIFQHFSYATREQVIYKSKFYPYKGLVEQWDRLQLHQNFPCKARDFFNFASPDAVLIKEKSLT